MKQVEQGRYLFQHKHQRILTSLIAMLLMLACGQSKADIAIIVNPNNPIESLTKSDVKKIFLGRMRMFPNSNQATQVFDQDDRSDTYQAFYEQHLGFTVAKLKRYRAAYLFSGKGVIPTALGNGQSVINTVHRQEGAIGYIHVKDIDSRIKVVYTLTTEQE